MIETPQIAQTVAQPIAVIRVTVPREEMRKVMGPGLRELKAAVAAQNIATTGAWFTHHLRAPAETFDFEIGVPVAAAVTASGRMKPGLWPAMNVARTVLHGNYDRLGQAWGEFMAWIEAHGHRCTSDFWECYVTGPDADPDPATWRTQLNRPLLA